ncbi:MAG: VanW family protein [Clostridia bacterium]|jgi:vancomycin resistance protein YoaR
METIARHGRRRKARRKVNWGRLTAFILTMVLLTGGIFYVKSTIDRILGQEEFYEGIVIDNVALGGKTREEAAALLEKTNQPRLDAIQIALAYNGQEWNFGYEDIQAKLNIDEELDKAYRIGRQGSFIDRLKEIRTVKEEGYSAKTEISYDVEALKPRLAEIKKEIDKKPVDATVTFKPGASPQFTFTGEKKGYVLDTEKLFQEIKDQLSELWNIKILLEPEVVEPKVFKKDLERATKKIAHFSTDLGSSSAARRHNIKLSMEKFNGLVLMPGEELSFNETTGPRDLDKGYKSAPVIAADKSLQDGPGGGVCQSSSTLYNAFLLADVKILQRSHHSFSSSYVDIGFDATVNWPNLDLKVKNTRKTPIFIQTYLSGNKVHAVIYGEPLENGRTIKLSSEIYETIEPPEPKIIKDTKGEYVTYTDEEYEKVKTRTGYKVRTYQIIYERGKVVEKRLVANDYYKPIQGQIYVGVKERPAPEPPEQATNEKATNEETTNEENTSPAE